MLDRNLSEAKAIIASKVFIWILDVESATLSDHIQVFACMEHFLLVFGQEDWHHFFTVSESL